MPNIPQGELPVPKSWGEFEDIVCDLYSRAWNDPHAQRHGRTGQSQQGVDIYGQPSDLGGRYVGIQCKRYEDGRLTRAQIEAEIAKADQFRPPLAEYIIATTEHLDVDLQAAVREIDQARRTAAKFPVHIVFWEDLCSRLCDPANDDLLWKHYGDWLRRLPVRALPIGTPFQAPPLPAHFVPRPEVTDAVKAHLLADDPAAPGVLVVSAIHGLGGIGKSVLAAALSHDPDVQHCFPDGVLWATLGQQPDPLSLLSNWVQALGDYDFRPTTVDAASVHLRTLLHERAVLLVVDNVWDPAHALPFRVGGPRCQVLVTTRRADVAEELGAHPYQLDVMTPEQSLALLSARVRRPLEETERRDALLLAKAVGHLPLALELAGARVARGVSWVALWKDLLQEVAQLEALESPRGRRRGQLRLVASLNLSLGALRAEDEDAWRCFTWLGVLPEDTVMAAPMAATLWELEEAQAADLLALLRDDALLQAGDSVRVGERSWPGYRLHDLLHDMARRLLTAEGAEGIGLALTDAHAHLLERYRARTRDGLWHTLPDDGYVQTHLAWHMERAGWTDALHALLREETPEGRNGWYEARERLGQTAGFLADVELAWRLAEEAFTGGGSASAVGLQCRYALILASLNSLAGNVPPALLVALVERGLWPPSQGLAYARQAPGSDRQARALAGLAPHLPEPLLHEALAAARQIKDENYRAGALVELAPHLPQPLLHEALAAARQIDDEDDWARALAGLAHHLPEPLLHEALDPVRKIEREDHRAEALTGLALHFSQPLKDQVLHEALVAALQIESEDARAGALIRLAHHLPEPLLHETLAAVRQIRDEHKQAQALYELAPHLPEPLLHEALAAARQIDDEDNWAKALAELAPYLPEPLLHKTLDPVRQIKLDDYRTEALAGLAPHLPQPLKDQVLHEALAAARQIEDEDDRAWTLAGPALRLAELGRHEEALTTARHIRDKHERDRALYRLAPHLSQPLKDQVLHEALVATLQIESEGARAWALAGLAPHLPQPLLLEALAAVRQIRDEHKQARALYGLAPHLPKPLLHEGLAAALQIDDEDDWARALVGLTPHPSEPLLHETLDPVRQIEREFYRAEALAGLALHLSEPLLHEALAAALQVEFEDARAWALAGLAPHLPEPLLHEALAAVRQIRDEHKRAWALAGLAPHLPEPLLHEALAAARQIESEDARAKALAELAPHLPESLLPKALAAAHQIDDEDVRAWALAGLALHLPKCLLYKVLNAVRQIEREYYRADALAGLAPHLPKPLLHEALTAARQIDDEDVRAWALAGLALHLPQPLLHEALTTARQIDDEDVRAWALTRLAPHLPEHLKEQALHEALAAAHQIEDEDDQAQALARLASHLPEHLLYEALAAARQIEDEDYRAEALATLPCPIIIRLWAEPQDGLPLLHFLACRSRSDLLSDLRALAPVLAALGGEEAIAETFRAIQDVGRWWP